ncbi:MAG: PEGA domain-containing protein, partial [Myxococcota bacterium]
DAAAGTSAALSLRTRPEGASVELDGGPVGATPLQLEVDEGQHRLRFELEGYEDARLVVDSVAGLTITRDIEMIPLEAPSRRRRPAHWAGIGLTAGGSAAIITGAVLMALHAREVRTPCEADAEGDCRQLFNTRIPGAVVLGSGVVMAAVGAGLWIHHAARRRR